jgi:hypothetical protein
MNPAARGSKPRRAINEGRTSPVAQARRKFYARALERVSVALDTGFVLEAVTLLESMIADRLEARLAAKHAQHEDKRRFSTLGKLAQELGGSRMAEPESVRGLYNDVAAWADRRNRALHEMVKLEEGAVADWDSRYASARQTAEDGRKLFRKLDRAIRSLS